MGERTGPRGCGPKGTATLPQIGIGTVPLTALIPGIGNQSMVSMGVSVLAAALAAICVTYSGGAPVSQTSAGSQRDSERWNLRER